MQVLDVGPEYQIVPAVCKKFLTSPLSLLDWYQVKRTTRLANLRRETMMSAKTIRIPCSTEWNIDTATIKRHVEERSGKRVRRILRTSGLYVYAQFADGSEATVYQAV